MSMDFDEEYILGDNVTRLATGKKPKESIVVSVRLTASEFYRLEKLCEDTGRSMSQLVRDAVADYPGTAKLDSNVFGVTLFDSEGTIVSVGPRETTSQSCFPTMSGLTGWNLVSSRFNQAPRTDRMDKQAI